MKRDLRKAGEGESEEKRPTIRTSGKKLQK